MNRSIWLAGLLALAAVANVGAAADPAPRFSTLLTSRTRETFVAIRDYATSEPAAPDRAAAVSWLLKTAPEWGWESEVISLAEETLQSKNTEPGTLAVARSLLVLGRASRGDAEGAVAALDDFLRSLRLRNPGAALDVAQTAALRFQLKGDAAAAAAVYDKVSSAFFLNSDLRDSCDIRKERLALLGKPVPAIPVGDLNGEAIDVTGFKGRVVMLDFWATTCRPCLEELPRLKQLHRELHPLGLDVLGVSLDEDAEVVKSFRETQRLPWRIALDAGKVTPEFRVRLIPCLMLADREGRIAATDVMPSDLRWVAERLLRRNDE